MREYQKPTSSSESEPEPLSVSGAEDFEAGGPFRWKGLPVKETAGLPPPPTPLPSRLRGSRRPWSSSLLLLLPSLPSLPSLPPLSLPLSLSLVPPAACAVVGPFLLKGLLDEGDTGGVLVKVCAFSLR